MKIWHILRHRKFKKKSVRSQASSIIHNVFWKVFVKYVFFDYIWAKNLFVDGIFEEEVSFIICNILSRVFFFCQFVHIWNGKIHKHFKHSANPIMYIVPVNLTSSFSSFFFLYINLQLSFFTGVSCFFPLYIELFFSSKDYLYFCINTSLTKYSISPKLTYIMLSQISIIFFPFLIHI